MAGSSDLFKSLSATLTDELLPRRRTESFSAASEGSHTAAEFIDSQLKLEADAREALPYKFDNCTRPLGSLRQLLFACLTCNPPPKDPSDTYTPAATCYSCSVQCHGEHELVELFNKRNFVCDCGTTRMPATAPCMLRINSLTNQKGDVVSEPADPNNKYNQNFKNRFCGCECDYEAEKQKGTMFQCLGLGTSDQGGCGEDWWHAACVVGLDPSWHENQKTPRKPTQKGTGGLLETISEVASAAVDEHQESERTEHDGLQTPALDADVSEDEEDILPPGFPHEDDFEGFICYKCVDANPWIKRYAGAKGFLEPVFLRSHAPSPETKPEVKTTLAETSLSEIVSNGSSTSKKRKAEDDDGEGVPKRVKDDLNLNEKAVPTQTTGSLDKLAKATATNPIRDDTDLNAKAISTETTGTMDMLAETEFESAKLSECKYDTLPTPPPETVSLFFKSDFRDHLCRCPNCFPRLAKHPQLLEEEIAYEPPVSEDGDDAGGSTNGGGSLLERGESALTNVDRVRAIEGVMAYNQLKEKLTPFFKEFAESGKAISAEDIKSHFAKMRGDEEAIKQAGDAAASSGNNRREQSGY